MCEDRPNNLHADDGDTTTLPDTLEAVARNLAEVGLAPTREEPCAVVGDKGYHSREGLKELDGGVWKTRIAEPKPAHGFCVGMAMRRRATLSTPTAPA